MQIARDYLADITTPCEPATHHCQLTNVSRRLESNYTTTSTT
jgi:hypothetical protein